MLGRPMLKEGGGGGNGHGSVDGIKVWAKIDCRGCTFRGTDRSVQLKAGGPPVPRPQGGSFQTFTTTRLHDLPLRSRLDDDDQEGRPPATICPTSENRETVEEAERISHFRW